MEVEVGSRKVVGFCINIITNMEKFVPKDIAVAMAKAGFHDDCNRCYTDNDDNISRLMGGIDDYRDCNSVEDGGIISAPTYSNAMEWFRQKGVEIEVGICGYVNTSREYSLRVYLCYPMEGVDFQSLNSRIPLLKYPVCSTWEDAANWAMRYVLKNIFNIR